MPVMTIYLTTDELDAVIEEARGVSFIDRLFKARDYSGVEKHFDLTFPEEYDELLGKFRAGAVHANMHLKSARDKIKGDS